MGVDGPRALALCDALLDAYAGQRVPSQADPLGPRGDHEPRRERAAVARERSCSTRAPRSSRGTRRFVRGPRYEALAPKLRAKAEKAFAKYGKRLSRADRVPAEALEVIDAAFRVAGTGSLGCLRVAILVRGKGGRDGAWIFDMKARGDAVGGVPRSPASARARRARRRRRSARASPARRAWSA